MVTAQRLPAASELVGHWLVIGEDRSCPVALETAGEGTNRLVADPACLAQMGLMPAESWYPAPDGIAFAGGGGQPVTFFSRHAEGYRFTSPQSGPVVLRRRGD